MNEVMSAKGSVLLLNCAVYCIIGSAILHRSSHSSRFKSRQETSQDMLEPFKVDIS